MRTLLVISCIFLTNFVYSQTEYGVIIDSLPILKINKKELVNTSLNKTSDLSQDSFPRTTIRETMIDGRKIRVVTEYTKP